MNPTRYHVALESEEYGTESFGETDNSVDAQDQFQRVVARCEQLKLSRTVTLTAIVGGEREQDDDL